MRRSLQVLNISLKALLVIGLVTLFVSCPDLFGADDNDGANENRSISTSAVQKGPFVTGSSITIQTLDAEYNPTGQTFSTQTTDNLGQFSLGSVIETDVVEIIASGFYFDEVAGEISNAELTLRSVVDLSEAETVNVNMLTTLSKDRIIHLVTEEGLNFNEAKAQAEQEVLDAFHVPWSEDYSGFETMDISESGEKDAILLAISAVLQANNSVGELSELISKINNDIKGDGTVDIEATRETLQEQSKLFDFEKMTAVRNNLVTRYSNLGLSITVPSFEDFVDSNGDGEINRISGLYVDSYTITYDGNGNTVGTVPSSSSEVQGTNVSVPTVDIELLHGPEIQDGIKQRWIGWNTSDDGSGTMYEAGDSLNMPAADTVLYAQWTEDDGVIGKLGPAGGYVFYDKGTSSDGWRYMEVAPERTEWQGKAWGGTGFLVGTAVEVGTGKTNTEAIVEEYGESEPYDGSSEYPARLAYMLNYGGYSDWFLPSKDELALIYENIHLSGLGNFDARTQRYFSSSEYDANSVWEHYFEHGAQSTPSKYNDGDGIIDSRAARQF